MARLDVKTLVLAFEKRIEALEKNPPDKVPMAVILSLLETAVEEVIKEHFIHLAKEEITKEIKEHFAEMKDAFIEQTITNILTDEELRQELEDKLKNKIRNGIEKI